MSAVLATGNNRLCDWTILVHIYGGVGANCPRIANGMLLYPFIQYFNTVLRENYKRLRGSVSISSTATNIKEVMRRRLSEGSVFLGVGGLQEKRFNALLPSRTALLTQHFFS